MLRDQALFFSGVAFFPVVAAGTSTDVRFGFLGIAVALWAFVIWADSTHNHVRQ